MPPPMAAVEPPERLEIRTFFCSPSELLQRSFVAASRAVSACFRLWSVCCFFWNTISDMADVFVGRYFYRPFVDSFPASLFCWLQFFLFFFFINVLLLSPLLCSNFECGV